MAREIIRNQLRGKLLEIDHAGYDAACVIWSRQIDRTPELNARNYNTAAVVACAYHLRGHHTVDILRRNHHA